MEMLRIFDEKFQTIIKNGIKSVLLESADDTPDVVMPEKSEWASGVLNSLACSYCRIEFTDGAQQREHYKLDWHRYNLKQSLIGESPITEDEFHGKTEHDEISSISGSDSDKEDTLNSYATAQGKIFLQNECGRVFSIYSCLLLDKKEDVSDNVLFDRLIECSRNNKKWTVLMLGGGHFAGAIFNGATVIFHKTFHCYTVRAGQGGSQSSRDSKSGGTHPKSAGASLRRYNEQSLVQHVKSIVELWKNEIDKCCLIIYRASGPHNRSVLFGGSSPILDRNDSRLRTIPFSTRRATFAEVKRVHSLMTTAQIYESCESAVELFLKQKEPEKRSKPKTALMDRAKTRETNERPLPVQLSDSSEDEDLGEMEMSVGNLEISFNLECFGDSLTAEEQRRAKKTPKKKQRTRKSKTQKFKEQEDQRKNEIIKHLIRGNPDELATMLGHDTFQIDEFLDDGGNTALHLAAMNEHSNVVMFLLDNSGNPCVRNNKQETPYTSTQSKEIRDVFKQFAKDNPDKYNYNKANIPINALTNEELVEKRKVQRKIKKEKEKIKRTENEIKRKEDEEKERFLLLSDREKRAVAAERRILSQSGAVISRCFLCATDITGKVPFEYLGNRFCTVDCLKAHRMRNPTILS